MATTRPAPSPPESPADELDRLERRARTDEAALADLRDDLHNANYAVAQAQGADLHAAMTRKRELERRLDQLLEESAPVIARCVVLRKEVAAAQRVAQIANVRAAGNRFKEAAEPVTTAFTDAFAKLATLTATASAVTEAGRGCGPDVLRDVHAGMQLASIKSWLLSGIAASGLTMPPAVERYDPHQLTAGVTPTAASADLHVYLETTR